MASNKKKILSLTLSFLATFGAMTQDARGVEKKKTATATKASKTTKKPLKKSKKTTQSSGRTTPIKIKSPLPKKKSTPADPDKVSEKILVDLDYDHIPVGKVLHYFIDPLNIRLKFHGGSEKIHVSGNLSNMPWREALESILRQANLQYEVVHNVIEISNLPEPAAEEPVVEEEPIQAAEPAIDSAPASSMQGALVEEPSGPPIPMEPPGEGVPTLPQDPQN